MTIVTKYRPDIEKTILTYDVGGSPFEFKPGDSCDTAEEAEKIEKEAADITIMEIVSKRFNDIGRAMMISVEESKDINTDCNKRIDDIIAMLKRED